jgi:hypothetical protein
MQQVLDRAQTYSMRPWICCASPSGHTKAEQKLQLVCAVNLNSGKELFMHIISKHSFIQETFLDGNIFKGSNCLLLEVNGHPVTVVTYKRL